MSLSLPRDEIDESGGGEDGAPSGSADGESCDDDDGGFENEFGHGEEGEA